MKNKMKVAVLALGMGLGGSGFFASLSFAGPVYTGSCEGVNCVRELERCEDNTGGPNLGCDNIFISCLDRCFGHGR